MFSIDRTDEKILRELEQDGRASNVELSARVNLSPSQCLRRVRRLEDAGVIRAYRAEIDRRKLGYMMVAYVLVSVTNQIKGAREMLMEYLQDKPEVLSIHGVTGNIDLIFEVQARDLEHFTDLVLKQIYGHETVMNSVSYVILDTKKLNGISI